MGRSVGRSKLDPYKKSIYSMLKDNYTHKEIGLEYGVGRSTVSDWLKKHPIPVEEKKKQASRNKPTTDDPKKENNTNHLITHEVSGGGSHQPASTSLSLYIENVKSIQKSFVDSKLQCTVKDAILLREQSMQFEGMKDIPNWEIPHLISDKEGKNLYDPITRELTNDRVIGITKQMLIINAICDPVVEIVAVEAAKRHGKSTAAFVGICQGVWEGFFKKIGLWAAGEDNAIGILGDIFRDEISVSQTMPLFKGMGSQKQKVFFNNALIKAFSNNAAHTSGLDFDLCHIDEAHEVVVEHKEVFDMIIMTMRAKPAIKLLITMNKGTGTYHIFRDTLEKEFGKEVVFLTIEDGDITHITPKADKKVRTLVKAVGGKKEVDRWLNNKAVGSSTFDSMSVIYSYENYELFLATHKPIPKFTVASLDPSGTGHPMGFSIWSCDATGSFFWQRFGIEYELGDRPEEWGKGEKLNHRQIQADMFERAHKFKITHFISESNMNGKEMMIEFRMRGFTSENQNFGNDKNENSTPSRGNMCHVVRRIMDSQALFINSIRLRDQWSIYNPDEHEKSNKYKGDEADSSIQGLFYLCTLTNSDFLSEEKYTMEWV